MYKISNYVISHFFVLAIAVLFKYFNVVLSILGNKNTYKNYLAVDNSVIIVKVIKNTRRIILAATVYSFPCENKQNDTQILCSHML